MKIKIWEWEQKWLQKRNKNFYLEPMSNRDKEKKNNKLKNWRRENQEEARQAIIATQQSITQNRWRGLGAIFNSLATYQVLQPIKEEVIITMAQTDVEEVNKSTSDGT